MADPAAPQLQEFIVAGMRGPVPKTPPASLYHAGLDYLGRFGVIGPDGRGRGVGFVPAGQGGEPRPLLNGSCG